MRDRLELAANASRRPHHDATLRRRPFDSAASTTPLVLTLRLRGLDYAVRPERSAGGRSAATLRVSGA